MALPTKHSNAPGTSLSYITIGAILAVLSGTSFFFFGFRTEHTTVDYVRFCAFILGLVFLVIGFGVGRIGRVALEAEVPPNEPIAHSPPPVATPPAQPASVNPIYTTSTTPKNG